MTVFRTILSGDEAKLVLPADPDKVDFYAIDAFLTQGPPYVLVGVADGVVRAPFDARVENIDKLDGESAYGRDIPRVALAQPSGARLMLLIPSGSNFTVSTGDSMTRGSVIATTTTRFTVQGAERACAIMLSVATTPPTAVGLQLPARWVGGAVPAGFVPPLR